MTDLTTLPDGVALLAALDARDDSALPALADLLEEAGDPRAAGLRLIGDRRPDGVTSPWHWSLDQLGDGRWPHQLPAALLARVGDGRAYPSRAAALLALAEELARPSGVSPAGNP